MDPRTGRIYLDVEEEDAKRRGLIDIPPAELERVINMNRRERRAWAAKQRRSARPSKSS